MTETRAACVELPLQTRSAALKRPGTVDADARTVEVTWSTGARVRRRDFWTGERYDEELSLDPAHVDLSRLNSGAPLLNTHGAYDVSEVLGVVERAWVDDTPDGGVGVAVVRFSDRPGVDQIWRDVSNGILRNISVGYAVKAYEITDTRGDSPPVWRAVDWQPMELSIVPIGADAAAHIRSPGHTFPCRITHRAAAAHHEESNAMQHDDAAAADSRELPTEPIEERSAIADAGIGAPSVDLRGAAIAEERARIAGIYEACRKLRMPQDAAEPLVRDGVSLDQARAALINLAADRDEKIVTRSGISMGGLDATETRRAAVESALLHRFDPSRFELSPAAREWRGYSLIETARQVLTAAGERVRGLSPAEVATRALHSTSDFPYILAAVTGKTLRAAYEAAPRTFQPIARRVSAADFKDMYRVALGEAPTLAVVKEGGEYTRGTITESRETYRIATYGRVVAVTRQTLINDDLDAFTRLPALFGTGAAALESDIVWGIITTNGAMADGVALFHSTHKNLASTGTALDVTNLGAARSAMARQTGLDGTTILNVRPAYLVVPSSLELAAEQLVAQGLVPAASANVVPASIRSLTVISEPRLQPASGAVPWYLFASPMAIDTIEYAYLDGQDGVYIETRDGFDVDGVEIKARLDFGAKAIDWRGKYKNPGV